jgi:hypothetical protein
MKMVIHLKEINLRKRKRKNIQINIRKVIRIRRENLEEKVLYQPPKRDLIEIQIIIKMTRRI